MPKSEILEHVWDFAFDGDDNVVEVHISALRRKLGSAAIETVRGAGYRIGHACACRWPSSVRSRATIGATLILAIALAVGSIASAVLLHRALTSDDASRS